nr:hypothetical protein CFP56_34672 [Quercus suber]
MVPHRRTTNVVQIVWLLPLDFKKLFKYITVDASPFLTLLGIVLGHLQKLTPALGYRKVNTGYGSQPFTEAVRPGICLNQSAHCRMSSIMVKAPSSMPSSINSKRFGNVISPVTCV